MFVNDRKFKGMSKPAQSTQQPRQAKRTDSGGADKPKKKEKTIGSQARPKEISKKSAAKAKGKVMAIATNKIWTLEDMPNELLEQIFSYLGLKSLLNLSLTNQSFAGLIKPYLEAMWGLSFVKLEEKRLLQQIAQQLFADKDKKPALFGKLVEYAFERIDTKLKFKETKWLTFFRKNNDANKNDWGNREYVFALADICYAIQRLLWLWQDKSSGSGDCSDIKRMKELLDVCFERIEKEHNNKKSREKKDKEKLILNILSANHKELLKYLNNMHDPKVDLEALKFTFAIILRFVIYFGDAETLKFCFENMSRIIQEKNRSIEVIDLEKLIHSTSKITLLSISVRDLLVSSSCYHPEKFLGDNNDFFANDKNETSLSLASQQFCFYKSLSKLKYLLVENDSTAKNLHDENTALVQFYQLFVYSIDYAPDQNRFERLIDILLDSVKTYCVLDGIQNLKKEMEDMLGYLNTNEKNGKERERFTYVINKLTEQTEQLVAIENNDQLPKLNLHV